MYTGKKIIYTLLLSLLLCHFTSWSQTFSVSVYGGSCAGTPVTVISSNKKPEKIVWEHNGIPVDTIYATWNRRAITVAGSDTAAAGATASLLDFPVGLYVTPNDTIYIADYNNNRVQKWAPGATNGITIAGTGVSGTSDSQLYYPANVFLDSSKNLFVVDYGNSRVQKFLPGSIHASIVAGRCCTTGGSASMLDFPTGVYVDKADTAYVCDWSNFRIMRWAPGDTAGTLVAGGFYGTGPTYLNLPQGVFLDTSKNIYIADAGNNRIQKWPRGATYGVTLAGAGSGLHGLADTMLNGPSGVFVDLANNIYIADAGNNRIELYRNSSFEGVNIAGSFIGNSGIDDSLLNDPSNIFMDKNGNLFVTDAYNNRIQKFSDTISFTYTPDSGGVYTAMVYSFRGDTASGSISVYYMDTPTVNIHASTGNIACRGEAVSFTAVLSHMGSVPSYQWYKNGIGVGTNNLIYNVDSVANGDSIICVITTTNPCAVTSGAQSNFIKMTVQPDTTPSISIYGNSNGPVGSTIHLYANIVNAVAGYKINWIKNGVLFATTTAPIVTYVKTDTTDSISAVIIPTTGCYNSVVSNNWFVAVGLYVQEINNQNNRIKVFPNPFREEITISNLESNDQVVVYDMMGNTVKIYTAKKEGENVFSIKNVSPGAYIVNIFDKDGNLKAHIPVLKG